MFRETKHSNNLIYLSLFGVKIFLIKSGTSSIYFKTGATEHLCNLINPKHMKLFRKKANSIPCIITM